MNITVASGIDLGIANGYTIRVACIAESLGSKFDTDLISSMPSSKFIMDMKRVKTHFVNTKLKNGSIINQIKRGHAIIDLSKKLQKEKYSMLHIETSPLAGYFSLANHPKFVVDVHGFYFDELKYNSSNSLSIPLQSFMYYLERRGIKRASKVIVVSTPMKEFCMNKLDIPEERIVVIPNGYFEDKINLYNNIKSEEIVTFVGLLERWANVDKIIYCANLLKKENVLFYIVGDGPDRNRLEQMTKMYNLTNVVFTGYLPINKAYEIMAKSKILLAPFPKILALDVACPIKLLEYMALRKPIVVDNVGEIPAHLKNYSGALVSSPSKPLEFAENIRLLLDNSQIRTKIASNAYHLSKEYTWEKQTAKLVKLYESLMAGG